MLDIDRYETALADMAKAYRLGSPESRAIITAMEHARIVTGRAKSRDQDLVDTITANYEHSFDGMDMEADERSRDERFR